MVNSVIYGIGSVKINTLGSQLRFVDLYVFYLRGELAASRVQVLLIVDSVHKGTLGYFAALNALLDGGAVQDVVHVHSLVR
jgi:hypothetical protein